jgi:hypothetical protein
MQLLKRLPYWGAVALLIYMPLHVLLSQSLSLVTGGLDYWKLGKDVALLLLTVFSICLVLWLRRAERWYLALLALATAYAAVHVVLLLTIGRQVHTESAVIGLIYNLRLLCFVLLGASAAVLYPNMFVFRSIFKVVIGVSTLVALFGIVQYFLPADALTHLGYSLERGVRPAFFIDDNPVFPRIMSTLRDPNSLGAYLIIPLSVLTLYMLRLKTYATQRQVILTAVWLAHLTALYLTFSRSSWLAALIAMVLAVWWQFSSQFVRLIKRYWLVGMAIVVASASGLYMLRSNTLIDGVLTHSTSAQVGDVDSNEYHVLYAQRGIDGIFARPLGHGPGTAGLASIHNPNGGLLTENYYVQIGYEVGVLGLALFIGLHILLYIRIRQRRDTWTAVLLAAFWAYVVTNMLLHTWSNEAVAAQWWLLAGMALAAPAALKTGRGQSASSKKRAGA